MDGKELENLHTAASRGRQAKAELAIVNDALDKLKRLAIEQVMSAKPGDALNTERYIVVYQMVDAVKDALDQLIDAGEGAEAVIPIIAERLAHKTKDS